MSQTPQHVIWITCDHLRWDNIAAHGFDLPHTPHIDSLVHNGVTFANCFGQNPVCMPSRASFMTGCYPHQTGVLMNGQDLDPAFPLSVARCFSAAGYQTAQIGKLHFQSHEDMDLDPRPRHDYGFDIFWCDEEPGCYDGAYLRWLASERPDLLEVFRVPRPTSPKRRNEAREPVVLDAPWEYSFSCWIATQARRYLASWGGLRATQERHFMHLGFYAPHPPLNPTADMMAPILGKVVPDAIPASSQDTHNLSAEEIRAYKQHFAAMVTGIDMAVGKVLATLDELGIRDDTLIVFGSDHGDFCGDHGLVAKGPQWYDGVARVPLIMHWPNGLKGGKQVNGLVEMVDILPTMLDLAGLTPPPAMSGRSMAQALREGNTAAIGRPDVLAVHGPGHLMLRSASHKYIRYQKEQPQEVLFDLESDPDERHNCAHDPQSHHILQQMRVRSLQRIIEATQPLNPKHYFF